MTCFHPLKGQRGPQGQLTKKYVPHGGDLVTVPCGGCIGCRLDRARSWAIRSVHEASQHENNAFITLTYAPENLPEDASLQPRDFTTFFKRLRKHFEPRKIRYIMCGEYGDTYGRPHYHACIFGTDFPDRTLWSQPQGQSLYRSATLEKLWPYGTALIGDVTFQSAGYVARYVMKKINGPQAKRHYERLDLDTGEIINITPEYNRMSRMPGLGSNWFDRYHADLYPGDFTVINGKQHPIPRYYDQKLELLDPELLIEIKDKRKKHALLHETDNTPKRLASREICQMAKLKQLIRPIE